MANISTETCIFIPLGQHCLLKTTSLDPDRLRRFCADLQRGCKENCKKKKDSNKTVSSFKAATGWSLSFSSISDTGLHTSSPSFQRESSLKLNIYRDF